jgi:hypothetical protein
VIAGLPSAEERQIQSLIDLLDRHGMLHDLAAATRRERPGKI